MRAGAGDERLLQEAELYPTEVPPKKGHASNAANIVHDTSPRHDDFKMLAQMSDLVNLETRNQSVQVNTINSALKWSMAKH